MPKGIMSLGDTKLMQIKKVLVGIDGSQSSEKALDFALDFAEKFDAGVTILNVSESLAVVQGPQESVTYPGVSNSNVVAKDLRRIHEEILSKGLERARKLKPNMLVSSMLKEGDPSLEIVSTAKEGGFDAIVLGHKGLGKIQEILLGSVSEKVAHLAPCPLVIVR